MLQSTTPGGFIGRESVMKYWAELSSRNFRVSIVITTGCPESIHGCQLNAKDGYRLSVIGLQSHRKPPSPKRGIAKAGHFILVCVFLLDQY